MKAKEYLGQLERIQTMIRQKKEQADELREIAKGVGAIRYDKEKVQTSGGKDKIERDVIRYMEIEQQISDLISEYIERKDLIVGEIHSLCDVSYIKLLYMRYVQFKRLEVIAVELGYTYQYTRELHGRALQEFDNKILKVPTQTYIEV